MNNNSIKMRKDAIKLLEDYMNTKKDYIIIHYARQNCLNETFEKGPRILAIVTMNAESEQTKLFSLNESTNNSNYSFFELSESQKDEIEFNMLTSFFNYIKCNKGKKFVHWNMKNNNFGFSALENRYKQLGGNSFNFSYENIINLSTLLKKKYGINFAKKSMWNGVHTGKMYDIFLLNGINDINILNGEQEVKEYMLQNLASIEQSVLGKVKAFHYIIERASDNALKVRGNIFKDVYGLSFVGVAQYIQDNAILAILFSIIGGVISTGIYEILKHLL